MLDVTILLGQEVSIGTQPAAPATGPATAPAGNGSTIGPATGPATQAASQPATSTSQPGGTNIEPPKSPPGFMDIFKGGPMIFVLIFGLLYLFLFKGQKKEEKNRKKMVEQMKRGDEVMTIGGLVGKVVEVKEDRVVIKVDETTNVKETYLKSAIQRVITPSDKEA